MLLYAATIFVSAFLLFLVQPIIAKQILPWFGGSAGVWSTCLVFFQLWLLAGYTYADALSRCKLKTQAVVHTLLVLLALLTLPIIADPAWKPQGNEDPGWRILALLIATIGLPYFLVAASSSFVYVALADLIPQLQKKLGMRETVSQIFWLLAGIALVTVVSGLAHGGH